jgi:hypothetical protein
VAAHGAGPAPADLGARQRQPRDDAVGRRAPLHVPVGLRAVEAREGVVRHLPRRRRRRRLRARAREDRPDAAGVRGGRPTKPPTPPRARTWSGCIRRR